MTIRECLPRLTAIGIEYRHALELRRIAMTLHGWSEAERGSDHGYIERDKKTRKPFWFNPNSGHHYSVPDRESGALKRLAKLMKSYPALQAYIHGDPRGATLYILRPGDVPAGPDAESYYNNGIAVYK